MIEKISSSELFLSSTLFLVGLADRTALDEVWIAAILAKLSSLSWQALAVIGWSSSSVFYYAIINKISIYSIDHLILEAEYISWALVREQ